MEKRNKIIIAIASYLLLSVQAQASISDRLHKRCLDARDYFGCIKINTKESNGPKELEKREQSVKVDQEKNFSIGLEIISDKELGLPVVHSVIEGSPAKRNQIRKGDIILGINNISTRNIELEEGKKIIQSTTNRYVILTIERNKKQKTIKLTRDLT